VDVDPDKAIADLTGGNQPPGEPAPEGAAGATAPGGNAGSGSPPRGGAAGPGGSGPSRGGPGRDADAGTPAGRTGRSKAAAGQAPSGATQDAVPALGRTRNAAGREATASERGAAGSGRGLGGWLWPAAGLLALGLGAAVLFVRSRRGRDGTPAIERPDVDALTGIPNYLAFEERFADEWRRARRYGRPLGVVLLALEGLQGVNDRFGYEAGDRMVCAAAEEICDHIRGSDLGARLTGDKFAVLCPETPHAGLKRLGDKLAQQLEQAGVRVSVGWAQLTDRDATPADLLSRAHVAVQGEWRDPGRPPTGRPDLAIAG
jgi:diguanylate cyclase (GGDEF)-like protein